MSPVLKQFVSSLAAYDLTANERDRLLPASGLVLLTGPTGTGKTTLLHALAVSAAAEGRRVVVVDYEWTGGGDSILSNRDPAHAIRYVAVAVSAQPTGHCTSQEMGIGLALTDDARVLVIGEMSSPAAIALALWAADSGYLVLTTSQESTIAACGSADATRVAAQLSRVLRAKTVHSIAVSPEHERTFVVEVLPVA